MYFLQVYSENCTKKFEKTQQQKTKLTTFVKKIFNFSPKFSSLLNPSFHPYCLVYPLLHLILDEVVVVVVVNGAHVSQSGKKKMSFKKKRKRNSFSLKSENEAFTSSYSSSVIHMSSLSLSNGLLIAKKNETYIKMLYTVIYISL